MLESQIAQRAGCDRAQTPARGEARAIKDRCVGNAEGMRAAEAGVPEVIRARASGTSRTTRARLGEDGHVLQLSSRALDAHPNDECRRITICSGPASYRAAKRFKKVENATALIWKMLLVVQQNFRKLNAPHLLAQVYAGTEYHNGIHAADQPENSSPPDARYHTIWQELISS